MWVSMCVYVWVSMLRGVVRGSPGEQSVLVVDDSQEG